VASVTEETRVKIIFGKVKAAVDGVLIAIIVDVDKVYARKKP